MNKKYLYRSGLILLAFAIVFATCKDPVSPEHGINAYTYTVIFDKNHPDATGWTDANPKTRAVSSPATTVGSLPTIPTRQNWQFSGWNTAQNGNGTPFTASTPITKDTTVYAQWNKGNPGFTIALNITGEADGDSVTILPASGAAGDTVTITYTLASPNLNNRLVFSGVIVPIAPIEASGSGTREYVINENDAVNGTITMNATFTHTDLQFDDIAFTGTQQDRTYGSEPFIIALSSTGAGSGAVSYYSSDPSVATVDPVTGEVTIHGAGSTTITAVKASDGTYEETRSEYILNVDQLQLSIDEPLVTTTRQYNGNNTAEVTAGALLNKVGSDTVIVSATATYNSANVAEANLITVEYAIEGASAPNYIKPDEYTIAGTISKANGIDVASPPTATSNNLSQTSITLTAVILVNNSTYQTVEYACASEAAPVPTSGWQDGTTFAGLTANTEYYFFARTKENDNYETGTAKTSDAIKTQETVFSVALNTTGETDGDSVSLSSESGKAGVTVTINYTVASSGSSNNQLAFSGVSSAIEPVTAPGSGAREYVINGEDAANGTITIYAVFNHTNLMNDIIAFTGAHQEDKTYGDGTFTKTLNNTGNGTGAITYSSGTTTVATVNSSTGLVTIVGVGDSVITATKASDGNYAEAKATYLLKVAQRQLVMNDQTVTTTKTYDGNTTAAVTAGTLSGRVGNDTVNVSTIATYNSANVAEANQIAVVYTMSGTDAGKYFKPTDYTTTGIITKATGIDVASPPTATNSNISQTSVTLTAVILVNNSTVQTVEYARAPTNSAPSTGWQDGKTFDGLTANTQYYFFARSKGDANYNAGTAKNAAFTTSKTVLNIALTSSGSVSGDSVTRSPISGVAGDTVTINYTVASSGNANNRLDFSGVSPAISPVTAPGSGTRMYVINEADAANGTITINATFNHTSLMNDTIAFTGTTENKTYGDGTFTKALTNTGSGTGAITYSSGTTAVATVNNSGLVTIVGVGDSVITATKASDVNYAGATATYTLKVAQKQLTMSSQTVTTTKTYNNSTTAAVTAGTLSGRVGNDTVNVTTSATYNSANVAEANLITVIYSMNGADAGKYIKPSDYTIAGTITKANGAAMSTSTAVAASNITTTSVTLNTIGLTTGSNTGQTVEYARASTSTAPSTGWQEDRTFNNLTPDTPYYFFARSKENGNYNAGTAKASVSVIRTNKVVLNVALNISGNGTGDSVTRTPTSGSPGDSVTINYTLARTGTAKNELVFSGVNSVIDPVNASGTGTAVSGTKTYTISESDAANGTITINATFTHTNLVNDIIAFGTPTTENRTYGDSFTKALSNTGNGTGTISYSSSDTAIATVNSSTGAVTIVKNGATTITATKASDGTYAAATVTYTLNVAQKQLTISNPTVTATKTYNGDNTAAVTAGTLSGRVGSDTVTVSASATYDTADAGTGKTITVVYTIAGADAGKYLKPVNYTTTGTINKASGIAMSGSTNLTAATITQTSVTLNTIGLTGGSTVQTVEYARASAATPVPTSGYQDDRTFNNLTPDTVYYFFARSKENTNYLAGTPKASDAITTLKTTLNVALTLSGNASGDSASLSRTSGVAGDTITINYTLARTGTGKNQITFAGTNTVPDPVTAEGTGTAVSGTRTYIINAADAVSGTITITATFSHPNLQTNTIAFTGTTENRTYGSGTFTKTLTNTGSGTGAITYSSSDTAVATVTNSGLVTIVGAGTCVITATKASDGTYAQATATYTLTVAKATGSAIAANPTAASSTSTSITLTAATLSTATGQAVEYARNSSTTTPTTGWQEDRTFTGLTANTQYYFFARSKENANYNAGTARNAQLRTAAAGTPSVPPVIVDFENDAVGKKYESTRGDNEPTRVEVTADPARSGQKSLRVTTNASGNKAYNQAAVIPIKLPYALNSFKSFSFRFYPASGTSTGQIMVYAAGSTGTFVRWGFGNASNASNQFAANLIGQTANVSFTNTGWVEYNITITNPGSAISNLKGDIFIAIGINEETSLDYYLDDLTFTISDSFVPPAPPPSTTLNPPSTGAVSSKTYRNMFKEFGKSDAEITAKVNSTFTKLFNGTADQKIYYEVSGNMAYILDSGNNDVRSEGMSYGMMMCVQMDDQAKFDKLWRWAKTNMYNTGTAKNCRAYFAWQCGTDGSKKDAGCAPDGEFYFATALLFADARWGSASGATNVLNYRQHAMELLYEMQHRDTSKGDNYGEPPIFRLDGPGQYMTTFQPQGSAANMTDPSYHLPAFYDVWAIEMEKDADAGKFYGMWSNAAAMRTDAAFYKSAATTSRAFFPKTTHATTGLGPDYATFAGAGTGNQPHFEYDAFRIAMNIAMDYAWFAADSWQKTFADRILAFFESKGVTTYKGLWELNGTARGGDHSPGLVACNAVASLAATNPRAWLFLDDFWNISMTEGQYRYYDGCLYMLGLLHVTGNFKAYLSGTGTYIPSSNIDPTSATFDKRSDLQKDIVVTLTLNGNTLSNIRNGGTTLTSGTTGNYTLSGSTVTLRSAYLATLPIGTTTLTFNFSAGSVTARTLDITVKETPAGGTPSGGTSFDFSTLTDVTLAYVGSEVSASITGGALRVVSSGSYKGAGVILTLDLGSQNLNSFTGIKLIYRGVSGDTGSKDFIVEVPTTAGGTLGNLGSNTRLITQRVNGTTQTTYDKINFAGTVPSRTGELKIAVGLYNTGAVTYDIILIELVP